MFKKIITGILCVAMVLSFAACNKQTETSTAESSSGSSAASSNSNSVADNTQNIDPEEILNFTEPQEGEEIAVFDIKDYGQIKIKLFEAQCPKGVENFKSLIESGYYDGITFHRVINHFMIQSGDPTGSGSGGESKWGKGFTQEISSNLRHFAGAVSYATATDKLNGSQFFIVTGDEIDSSHFDSLKKQYGKDYPDTAKERYYEKGGYPYLDGDYEVFGQVIEGLDICFEIAKVETVKDKPVKDVVISSAKLEKYKS